VKEVGVAVRKEVNKLYKCLELDIDGIFKSMLLLKKKKYAAVTIHERGDGTVYFEKEMKGLDLVRRDWCPVSKDAGKAVVEEILSGKPREEIVENIHAYILELTRRIREGEEDLARFVVTKGLNKSPKDYPDCKAQAHLQVALKMIAANKPVNIGDHIPYVICKEGEEGALPSARAHHPDEIKRSNGELSIDVEWYLENQILPPISRLCEPIEGTSAAILSSLMGLDATKYKTRSEDVNDWGFTLKSKMDDAVRFAKCEKLMCKCPSCNTETPFPGVMNPATQQLGLTCPQCGAMFYGRKNARDVFLYLMNRISLLLRACEKKYYEGWLQCEDHTCGCRTRQQSVLGNYCIMRCNGRMSMEYDDEQLHLQLKYLEALFDTQRYKDKYSVALDRSVSVEQLALVTMHAAVFAYFFSQYASGLPGDLQPSQAADE
jgi:DNA polymerase alpha subunit A